MKDWKHKAAKEWQRESNRERFAFDVFPSVVYLEKNSEGEVAVFHQNEIVWVFAADHPNRETFDSLKVGMRYKYNAQLPQLLLGYPLPENV